MIKIDTSEIDKFVIDLKDASEISDQMFKRY